MRDRKLKRYQELNCILMSEVRCHAQPYSSGWQIEDVLFPAPEYSRAYLYLTGYLFHLENKKSSSVNVMLFKNIIVRILDYI